MITAGEYNSVALRKNGLLVAWGSTERRQASIPTSKVVEWYHYDAFGNTTIKGPGGIRTYSAVGNRFMFTGREYDHETGNYYYRARYYSPKIGRFLQTDPIGYSTGLNLYTYCSNNPLRWFDPLGLNKQADEVINKDQWEEYLQGVYSEVMRKINLVQAGFYETSYNGTGMFNNQRLYYVEPLGRCARGSELNYIGQGMMYARFGIPRFLRYNLPYNWKAANILGQTVNPWWDPKPRYQWPTENELISTTIGWDEFHRILQSYPDDYRWWLFWYYFNMTSSMLR